jgi:hypothetical protein
MTQLTVEIIQEGGLQIVEVLHSGPRGAKGDPGETLVLTGPALAGRASGSGNLVAIPLAPGLAIVNGALTLTGAGSGTVTSVGLTVPNGFSVANSPITGSGTLALTFATGYSLPTTAKQGQWDQAYADLGQARPPSSHKASHATGGADALTPGDIGAAAASHGHAISDVSGLSSALQAKADLVNGVLATSQLPALAITQYLGAVANQAALLALAGERGDWAIRLDRNSVWILSADAPSLLTSWVELPIPTGVVLQVNNQTGVVTLGPGDVGAEPAGTTATALAAHLAAANPHNQYELKTALKDAAYKNTGTTAGTVAAGDDARFATLEARLNAFRDAATFYVSKRITASDTNNGTSDGEPFLTGSAAIAAAKAYVAANPGKRAKVEFGPGTYVEASLPFRTGPNILATGKSQRTTILKPASGQEFNGFFALDSGCMVMNFTFAGHQATGTSDTDSSVGTRAWAIAFDQQANGGQGPIITASPYVKDCASITAEDDDGLAGSISTGDTGGGIEVDGAKCHPSSPVRSMVVYGYTQQNLGGPGVVVKNDAYAELVSFFGLFCTWHVQAETGGWATLSGGGCSEFGTYGVVADGYSATALYTGSLRVAASAAATSVDVVSLTSNRLGSSSRPYNGQIMLLGGTGYVVVSSSPINSSGTVVVDSDATRVGYRVSIYNPTGVGLVASAAQGATADFRRRSQVSAGCHTALFVGSGTNYNALPWNGGVPVRANQFVERNFGRVFGLSVNDAGDISAAGGAFAVDGTSGSVTINTSEFNISGLNAVGPFSRNGGLSTIGVQLKELSNNITLLNSLGIVGQDTAPTQFGVKGYIDPLLAQLAPLNSPTFTGTVSGISKAMVGLGNVDNISDANKPISNAAAAALAAKVDTIDSRLTDAREWTAETISQAESEAGTSTTRRAFTAQRVFQAIASWWAGSAAKAKLDGIAAGATANATDAQLRDRNTHTGTQLWSTITNTPTTLSGYGITDALTSAAAASTYQLLSTNLTALGNNEPAFYLSRLNHTGTQPASTITGLANVATSGAYNDLSGLPTLFNPAIPGAIGGTTASTASFTRLGSKRQVVTATGSPLTITLDASAVNEFVASTSIAANTTISITGLGTIPSDEVIRYVFAFTWASGAITLSASGYTFKRAGTVPASAGDYRLLIEARGDSTVLLASYGSAYT